MITLTKEQLIASAHARIEFAEMMLSGELEPLKERTWSIELELARIELASLEAEAVAFVMADDLKDSSIISTPAYRDLGEAMERTVGDVVALYAAPPASVTVPKVPNSVTAETCNLDEPGHDWNEAEYYAQGWNACRDAMIQGAEPVQTTKQLPDDFDFDRFNDVVWLEAVASNPHMHSLTTSTIAMVALELNKQLEAVNSPAIPGEVLSAVRKVACIRADFDGFDGDRRGIGDCLDEAEQELIVTINKYASVIAAAPQQEVK
ncbi:hypothetical protein [Enterobacter roggenkampii]|uniref:hypothetical protein n=1 Tax=Enterobacter roggenkampii TaxID=1812935 RepID=UPI00107ECE47|nr:hypothetical protein [Enterobacter roggenkampii]QBX83388.1 hypothetical protein E4005_00300 [Enterobacter roggenkampii]